MSDKNVYKKIYKAVVREGVRQRENKQLMLFFVEWIKNYMLNEYLCSLLDKR